ncbi:hypothetical protein GWK47_023953 [Chionoecetes opilio]|uniref:Uncharacterized protein n=1 Tax=Chionoecetes opilio TaxID=41210 RepID=A0A8J4XLF1_CHIOP|nr:hypothetical protein GWK47_023953 [Chionoecetes opilio]
MECLKNQIPKMQGSPDGPHAASGRHKNTHQEGKARPAPRPASAVRWAPRPGAPSAVTSRSNVTERKGRDGGDFGMRYRPHLDKYFLKPERQQAAKRSLEEWEQDVKKCSHPRWRRKIFLGDTYFTCDKCGSRRRQAVAPTTFKMSRGRRQGLV